MLKKLNYEDMQRNIYIFDGYALSETTSPDR